MLLFECLSALPDDYRATKVHLGIPVPFIESRARLPLALILGFITSSKNRRASSLSLSIKIASRRITSSSVKLRVVNSVDPLR